MGHSESASDEARRGAGRSAAPISIERCASKLAIGQRTIRMLYPESTLWMKVIVHRLAKMIFVW